MRKPISLRHRKGSLGLKSISRRDDGVFSALEDYPTGIPMAHGWSKFNPILDGGMEILFEPPHADKNVITIGVVGRLPNTNHNFSGYLETSPKFGHFLPSKDLTDDLERMIDEISEYMKEDRDETSKKDILNNILNAIVTQVPAAEIYEDVNKRFPVEYNTINRNYKKRWKEEINRDMEGIVRNQRDYKSASFIQISERKIPLRKDDVVVVRPEYLKPGALQEGERGQRGQGTDAGQIQMISDDTLAQIKKFDPTQKRYIIYEDPNNGKVKLVGKDKNGKVVLTDGYVDERSLQKWKDPRREDWYSPEQRDEIEQETEKTIDEEMINMKLPSDFENPPEVIEYIKSNKKLSKLYLILVKLYKKIQKDKQMGRDTTTGEQQVQDKLTAMKSKAEESIGKNKENKDKKQFQEGYQGGNAEQRIQYLTKHIPQEIKDKFDNPPEVITAIKADPNLKQVFDGLLNNAINYGVGLKDGKKDTVDIKKVMIQLEKVKQMAIKNQNTPSTQENIQDRPTAETNSAPTNTTTSPSQSNSVQ